MYVGKKKKKTPSRSAMIKSRAGQRSTRRLALWPIGSAWRRRVVLAAEKTRKSKKRAAAPSGVITFGEDQNDIIVLRIRFNTHGRYIVCD